jgi:hypothetical protein
VNDETAIMVGDKSIGTYCNAVTSELEEEGEAMLLSRGQENNGKALDVIEIVRREESVAQEVSTRTASFENSDGEEVNVTELEAVVREKEDQ